MSYRWWPERWTTGRLMVWLAIGSTVLAAWAFSRNYGTSDRAWVNHNAHALLNASTPRERAGSAQVLGGLLGTNLGGPAAIEALATSSGADVDSSVRAASVEALGNGDDSAAIGPIRRALLDDAPEVRLASLHATTHCRAFQDLARRDPAEAEAMAATAHRFLADPDPSTRRAALYLLTAMPGAMPTDGSAPVPEPRGRLEALAMFEHDADRANRGQALQTLVYTWPDRSLYAPLIRRLDATDDPGERATIARWAGRLPSPSAATLKTLVEMMDRDVALAPMVAVHVAMLGRGSAAPYLPAIARAARREVGRGPGPIDACYALFRLDPESAAADEVAAAVVELAASNPDSKHYYDAALQVRERARPSPPSQGADTQAAP